MKYPTYLQKLILFLKKLPSVGSKSAERFAFQMINWSEEELADLGHLLKNLPSFVQKCDQCGFLLESQRCSFCSDAARNKQYLCIVTSIRDIFSIENTKAYSGLYHILDSLLSPIEGKYIEQEDLEKIFQRTKKLQTQEIILALDATVEGDVTALFLKKELMKLGLKVTKLASGVPIGSSLEYIDDYTLAKALTGRQSF